MKFNGKVTTLKEVEDWVDEWDIRCRFCEEPLAGTHLETYDHDGGYEVEGYSEKQWLYVTCPNCGHQWSLVHLEPIVENYQANPVTWGRTPEDPRKVVDEPERRRVRSVKAADGELQLVHFDHPVQCEHPGCPNKPWMNEGYIYNGVRFGKDCMKIRGLPHTLNDFF